MRALRLPTVLPLFAVLGAVSLSGCIAFVDPDRGCAGDADCPAGMRCDATLRACVGRATAGSTTAGVATASSGTSGSASASGTSSGAGSSSGLATATAAASSSGAGSAAGSAGSTSGSGSSSGSDASGSSGGTGTTCSNTNPCAAAPPCQTVVCNGAHVCEYSNVPDGNGCGSGHVCTGGSCLCPPNFSDCSGTCIDVSSDASNCGACGAVCSAGMPCQNGGCKSFFGAFEQSSACGGATYACERGNPELGGTQCACPSVASVSPHHDDNLLVDIDGGIGLEPSGSIAVCAGSEATDFGGMYTTSAACGGGGCITSNSFTGTCSCPGGYVPISLPAGHSCSGCAEPLHPDFGTVVLCWSPTAALSSFGGAYEIDDGDAGCRVANPANQGTCSCPVGTTMHPIRVLDTFQDGGWIGANIVICSVP